MCLFFDNIADGPEFDPSLPSMKRVKFQIPSTIKTQMNLVHCKPLPCTDYRDLPV